MAATTSDPATPSQGVRASLPRAARLFVLAVVVAAAVVVGLYLPGAARDLRGGAWPDLWPPLLYAAGLVIAERFVVKVPLRHHRFSVGVCDMVIVLGVVFIHTPLLVLATGAGIAVSQWLFEPNPVKRLFNVPQYVLSVTVAAVVTSGLVDLLNGSALFGAQLQTDPASSFKPALAVVWVLGMAAFFLANHSLVSMVVSLSLGRGDDGALEVITPGHTERLTVAPSPSAWEQAAKGYAARAGWPRYTMVPMEAEGGRVVGYAAAYGPRVDADFTGDDAETLLTLANQGAVALVNEELYREAESERAALRDIVGHSTDGIYTVGPDRTVSSWNAAMVALTGYQEDEAVGQKCFNLLRARDGDGVDMCAADCPILAAAASGHEEVRDASVLNKEGLARWIRYAHAPIIGGDGAMNADVVVVRDVTRERQTDELKADFVASVSHELRTPLTPIKGFLMTLLREDRDFTQDRRHEYYKLMLVQSQRLERLIEDLLEVTRLEAGAGLVDATAIDAVDLVNQVVDRFTSEDDARVVHVVAPGHAVYCRGDWMRIDQVLGNLLSNALRYAPPHEPVEVRLVPQGREVVFEVRDWGPGIPIDEQSRIFERFHRVGHYMTREPGGAGLGLYLAKRLVEAMGGRIWVSSRLGHGSVFSFALPSEPSLNVVAAPRGR